MILSSALFLLGDSASNDLNFHRPAAPRWPDPERMIPTIALLDLFMVITITGAALIRWRGLSSRGGAVAEALGGQLISPDTRDLLERRFLNVTEEMALAANTPVPALYVLPGEEGINAFASGPTPEHSAIAVTRGALERLSRDELQGVVAHEFSHIVHGDVRLNIRLAAYIFGLTFLSEIGARVLNAASESSSRRRKDDKGGAAALFLGVGLFFVLFGLLGKLVSVLLSAAISREREYLADATAVQFTRNPDGIAGALKKIGGFSKGATISTPSAQGLSHFFLASSRVPRFFDRLFASHPPLLERIQRVDPHFEGVLPDDTQIGEQSGEEELAPSPFASLSAGHAVLSGGETANSPRPADWFPPNEIHSSLTGLPTAEALVIAILIAENPYFEMRTTPIVSQLVSESDIQRQLSVVRTLSLNQRVSALFMLLPTLQQSPQSRKDRFWRAINEVIEADKEVSLFEFLAVAFIRGGTEDADRSFSLRGGSLGLGLSGADAAVGAVLSICARCSAQERSTCEELYREAANHLSVSAPFTEAAHRDISAFLNHIAAIRTVSPRSRGQLIDEIQLMIHKDGRVTDLEEALLRICSVLLRTELPQF